MFDWLNINFIEILFLLPAVVISLSCHEYAHARIAYALGDPTAKLYGRMTINPMRHLDIMGTIMLLLFRFGWAKPVPINPNNFRKVRNKRTGVLLVSLAGPMMNIILMVLSSSLLVLLYRVISPQLVEPSSFTDAFLGNLSDFLVFFGQINVVLALFNLIPVPPLDGSKILSGLLPAHLASKFYLYESYGWIVLVLLMFTGIFSHILNPVMNAYRELLILLCY